MRHFRHPASRPASHLDRSWLARGRRFSPPRPPRSRPTSSSRPMSPSAKSVFGAKCLTSGCPTACIFMAGEFARHIQMALGFCSSTESRTIAWGSSSTRAFFFAPATASRRWTRAHHGESEGSIATYGWLERNDTRAILDELVATEHPAYIFALGESMGAGIALQSAAVDPRIEAVVAEAPFASIREASCDYAGNILCWEKHFLLREHGSCWRVVRPAASVSPERAVASRPFPVFLFCDAEDTTLPCRHAERIYAAAIGPKSLWIVPQPTTPRHSAISPMNSSVVCCTSSPIRPPHRDCANVTPSGRISTAHFCLTDKSFERESSSRSVGPGCRLSHAHRQGRNRFQARFCQFCRSADYSVRAGALRQSLVRLTRWFLCSS